MSLSYIFWPNPQATTYDNPKVLALFAVCASMVVLSLIIRVWRRKLGNTVTRRLTRSWPSALLWFAGVALVLVVARVEQISYISMRMWWIVWAVALLFFVYGQMRRWKAMHYEVLPQQRVDDPRAKYLPKKK
jgi:FtsH-binding integral membrane protein